MSRQVMVGPFDRPLSGLTRAVLMTLLSVYVVQLLVERWLGVPVSMWLGLGSLDPSAFSALRPGAFYPWQWVTAHFINADPMGTFLQWLAIYFFLPPVEDAMGTRRAAIGVVVSALFGAIFATGLDAIGAVQGGRFLGLTGALDALTVFFGLSFPSAVIRLFFVLPVKAAWVAWGTGLLSLLYLLFSRDLGSAVMLGSWIGAFLWLRYGPTEWRRLWLRFQARRTEKELAKFTVIPGGKGKKDDYYH